SPYRLVATSGGLTSATSNPVIVNPGAASQLVITSPPPATVAPNSTFNLSVAAEDKFGNIVTTYATNIVLALPAPNPGGGRAALGGTKPLAPTANTGVANFTGLSLNQAANGYTINVTSGSLTATVTSAINVLPAATAATKLVVTTAAPSTVTA